MGSLNEVGMVDGDVVSWVGFGWEGIVGDSRYRTNEKRTFDYCRYESSLDLEVFRVMLPLSFDDLRGVFRPPGSLRSLRWQASRGSLGATSSHITQTHYIQYLGKKGTYHKP